MLGLHWNSLRSHGSAVSMAVRVTFCSLDTYHISGSLEFLEFLVPANGSTAVYTRVYIDVSALLKIYR